MKIILDFDGCIVNTIKRVVDMYNQDYNDNVDWHIINSWGFKECTLLNNDVLNGYFAQQRFFNEELEFMPYARDAIKELAKNHKIVVCSMGSDDNLKYKEKWLNDNLGVYHEFIGVRECDYKDKSHIDMSGCTFIDDTAKNLETSNASVKICYGEVFPWNEFFGGSIRECDWYDFLNGNHSVKHWFYVCHLLDVFYPMLQQNEKEVKQMNILTVDLNRINEEVDKYIKFYPTQTPYVICSKETKDIIVSKCADYTSHYCAKLNDLKPNSGLIAQYQGYRMLIDDSLQLGEVKIR